MNCLPAHGRVNCTKCFSQSNVIFDDTSGLATDRKWRITWNPLSWGNTEPEIVVLGFSKGPTQAGALANSPHDEIAYKGSRANVGKILEHIGVMPTVSDGDYKAAVDRLITDPNGRFHFGSLIRCTVERFDGTKWVGSGGGMLDKFAANEFGNLITQNCASQFLVKLPNQTKLVIMFGLGTKQNYVRESKKLMEKIRPGNWRWINEVSYADSYTTFVHVEHFASQGALIPNWLGKNDNKRAKFGDMAKKTVTEVLA